MSRSLLLNLYHPSLTFVVTRSDITLYVLPVYSHRLHALVDQQVGVFPVLPDVFFTVLCVTIHLNWEGLLTALRGLRSQWLSQCCSVFIAVEFNSRRYTANLLHCNKELRHACTLRNPN
jgi:ABC-type sulfate transport system permease component